MSVALDEEFFERSVHEVARDLIGCELYHEGSGGVIVETESYEREDPACHAYVGLTPRTATLFGPPGRAYVYLSYGIHSLLNAVCRTRGQRCRGADPGARADQRDRRDGPQARSGRCPRALLRARQAHRGARDRARAQRGLARRAPFELRRRAAGWDGVEVVTGPRIGISRATELPWRFCAAGSRFVSRPLPAAA